MSFETILFEIDSGVGRLTLNVPEKLNALSTTMLSEMSEVIQAAESQGCRCLLITGEGRGFCSGADLTDPSAMGGTPPDLKKTLDKYYHPVVVGLQELSIPVVTAVNGVCAGAGTGLALTGDLIIAETSTRFNLGFVKIGLMPDAGSTWSLPRRVGSTRALEMSLLGEEISGSKAQEWGLINRAVAEGTLQDEALKLSKHLASGPTIALGLAKKALSSTFENSLTEQLEVEGIGQRTAGQTKDFAAGVMGFFSKKPPNFTGE